MSKTETRYYELVARQHNLTPAEKQELTTLVDQLIEEAIGVGEIA